MSGSVINPFGNAQFIFNPGDDYITDLCDPKAGLTGSSGGDQSDPTTIVIDDTVDPIAELMSTLLAAITPANSWLDYRNRIEILPRSGSVMINTLTPKPLPPQTGLGSGGPAFFGTPMDAVNDPLPPVEGGTQAPTDPNQQTLYPQNKSTSGPQVRTADTYRIRMRGFARRAIYQIPTPCLSQVAGVAPQLMWDETTDYWVQEATANMAGGVEYRAEWCITYVVVGPFTQPNAPLPNPIIGS